MKAEFSANSVCCGTVVSARFTVQALGLGPSKVADIGEMTSRLTKA